MVYPVCLAFVLVFEQVFHLLLNMFLFAEAAPVIGNVKARQAQRNMLRERREKIIYIVTELLKPNNAIVSGMQT